MNTDGEKLLSYEARQSEPRGCESEPAARCEYPCCDRPGTLMCHYHEGEHYFCADHIGVMPDGVQMCDLCGALEQLLAELTGRNAA